MEDRSEQVTFSFGANWQSYLSASGPEQLAAAEAAIRDWIGADGVSGRRVVDIGCGSGVHSLAFYRLGAGELVSFDLDVLSVEATRSLWQRSGEPSHWRVFQGSILDSELVESLSRPGFDLVYTWGVLHHTGAMWQAVENAARLVAPGGMLWIALYVKGPSYRRDLELKRRYNRSSTFGKRLLLARFVLRSGVKALVMRRFDALANLLFPRRYAASSRGMSVYHDIRDWLGGLPYEVASAGEVVEHTRRLGLVLETIETASEGGNHVYLLSRPAGG